MSHLKYSVILLLAVSRLVAGQDLSSLPDCGKTCFNVMAGKFNDFQCAAGDEVCLCKAPDYKNGINDCAKQNCAADLIPNVSNFLANFCAAEVGLPASATTPAPAAPTSSPAAAPETSQPPTPSTSEPPAPSPTSSPNVEPTTSQQPNTANQSPALTSSEPPAPTTEAAQPATTPTTLVTSVAPTPTPATTQTTTSSSSSTTSASTASSTSAATAADAKSGSASSSKISLGAIIGISIGAAAVILGGLIMAIIRRRHMKAHEKRTTAYIQQLKISEPMPGSGRDYAESNNSKGYGYGSPSRPLYPREDSNELEMRSRRYEDMVPRVAPNFIS